VVGTHARDQRCVVDNDVVGIFDALDEAATLRH
jgi:acyl-CoA dehydrogenase